MKKSLAEHYKHQIKYFDKEYTGMTKYKLELWQKSYIDRMKKYMLDKNYKKQTLIDIASGSGYIAIELAKLGMHVIATDMSPVSIKHLHENKKRFKLRKLKIIECKAEKIPLKSGSVDYVVANAILEHIPDEEATIKEWKRILKKEGKLYITVPLKFRYIWPFLWPINWLHDKRIGHLRRYDYQTLKKKFGLTVIRVFYTGHLIKVFGLIVRLFAKSKYNEVYFERQDSKQSQQRYGANNITVIFSK
jgi:ubiquinone/menaquinone biosynthesis C-methylase UbiE